MSRTDFFAKYTQIYAKAQAKEIVPGGTFVRQLIDVPRKSYDVGVFFKAKRSSRIVQVHLGNPIPREVASQEGFLETEDSTYLSRNFCWRNPHKKGAACRILEDRTTYTRCNPKEITKHLACR